MVYKNSLHRTHIESLTESESVDARLRISLLFTFRGLLLLALVLYLFLGPATNENDIIASVLAFSIAAILILLPALTAAQAIRLRRLLQVSLHPPDLDSESLLSRQELDFIVQAEPISLLPFYSLRLQVKFREVGVVGSEHIFSGTAPLQRKLPHKITFPNRGVWNIDYFLISLQDQLGISCLTWVLPPRDPKSFRIFAPSHTAPQLPTLSSSERPGDVLTDSRQRLGDPFDLKRYHPADGIRKVAWKIFARTGELITRHPEASMTPEGVVAIYIIARQSDDYVAAVAVSHTQRIQDLGLELLASCDGNIDLPIARTPAEIRNLLVDSTWNSASECHNSFSKFLDDAQAVLGQARLSRVLILVGEHALESEQTLQHCRSIGDKLEQIGAQPTFARVSDKDLTAQQLKHSLGAFHNLLFEGVVPQQSARTSHTEPLLQLCSSRSWECLA